MLIRSKQIVLYTDEKTVSLLEANCNILSKKKFSHVEFNFKLELVNVINRIFSIPIANNDLTNNKL